jgi:4-hydroxy-tetrahydrodipicolinate reductase
MATISVAVHGALGKVGREVISAVSKDRALNLVGAVDVKAQASTLALGDSRQVPLFTDIKELLLQIKPQVLVDFSIAEAAIEAIRVAAVAHVDIVSGTTGLTADNRQEIELLAKQQKVGIIISSNFALGAVVLIYLCRLAAKYFDNAEIIELHHDEKADAPSGTALTTARDMLAARQGKPFKYPQTKKENLSGCRGGQLEGVAIHSVRLPGFVASQEVIFGLQGQTLKIRHDAVNRECYMPGVVLAIKQVSGSRGRVQNLEDLLQLGGQA